MDLGQTDLFTKRTRKPPPALEFAVHAMLADTLRVALMPGWLWWHTPNEGARSIGEAGRLKRMGVKAGVSDFLLISPPAGRLHALELKRRGKKPTPAQMSFLALVRLAGGHSEWTDTFDGALVILKRWGAVRITL
jgi:hypothetical protein